LSATRTRLPAAERRAALIEIALAAFAAGSYRGVTTADIAREAGVSEPILYRHFDSKRALYLACLEEAWSRLRVAWDEIRRDEAPADWMPLMGAYVFRKLKRKELVSNLWIQALSEASEDPEIRRYLRRHLREVHDYLADAIRSAQAAGAVIAERDPEAEAWIFMSLGLLGTIGRRLGGLVEDDLPRIIAARRHWMLGVQGDFHVPE
jgi:AcrR family transcriptional regulator